MTFSGGCSRSIGPSRGRRWRSLLGCQPEVSSVFCGISCRLCIEYASITGEVQLARHTCKAGEHHGQRDKPGGGLDTKRYEHVRTCCPSIESKMDFSKSSSVCQELLSHKKLTKEAAPCDQWIVFLWIVDPLSGYLSTELFRLCQVRLTPEKDGFIKDGRIFDIFLQVGCPRHGRWIVVAALMLSGSEGKALNTFQNPIPSFGLGR